MSSFWYANCDAIHTSSRTEWPRPPLHVSLYTQRPDRQLFISVKQIADRPTVPLLLLHASWLQNKGLLYAILGLNVKKRTERGWRFSHLWLRGKPFGKTQLLKKPPKSEWLCLPRQEWAHGRGCVNRHRAKLDRSRPPTTIAAVCIIYAQGDPPLASPLSSPPYAIWVQIN